MNEETKITLSDKELNLICNTEWIFTKQGIIKKIYKLFGELVPVMHSQLESCKKNLPVEIFNIPAKISKGENYMGLPYVMLDYPRYFDKTDSFAIRTFFWWGNFFSVTLHLSGKYKLAAIKNLSNQFLFLQQNDFEICISNNQWQHHFEQTNYLSIKNLKEDEFAAILNRECFIKIAKRVSLKQWDIVPLFIEKTFAELLLLLNID